MGRDCRTGCIFENPRSADGSRRHDAHCPVREALAGMAKMLWYGNYLLEIPGEVGYGDYVPQCGDLSRMSVVWDAAAALVVFLKTPGAPVGRCVIGSCERRAGRIFENPRGAGASRCG